MERDQRHQAASALRKFRLKRDRTNEDKIRVELQEIQESVLLERRAKQDTKSQALYQDPIIRQSVLLSCSIQLFTQTSGVNVIGYYGPRIYTALGYTSTSSLFIQALYGALALFWNTVCLGVVDRIGRRKLLIPSMIGMGTALCVEATLVRYFDLQTTSNQNALRASVAMNFVFSVFYTSLGVISWVYPAELFTTRMRARGTSLSTLTNWASNLIFAQCSPLALSRMGYQYFYIFVGFNWISAIIVWVSYPETQDKSTLEAVPAVVGGRTLDCFSCTNSPSHSRPSSRTPASA